MCIPAAFRPYVEVINDVAANPDYALLRTQTDQIADAPAPEVWVALGGGSVIDSAKVFAAANGDFGNVARFLETGSGAPDSERLVVCLWVGETTAN